MSNIKQIKQVSIKDNKLKATIEGYNERTADSYQTSYQNECPIHEEFTLAMANLNFHVEKICGTCFPGLRAEGFYRQPSGDSELLTIYAVNRADEKVQQAYRNSRDGIVVLPCYLPWKNGLYKTDALFVVYPSQRGGWSAQCVTDHKTKKSKLPFPQSWAGQPQEVIEQKSGIPGISFCHASRFLITAKDKETALAACRQVLKNNGRI